MKNGQLPFVLLLLLLGLIAACDRENIDVLLDEQVEDVDPSVTNFTIDHVRFNDNSYVYTSAAHASECDLYDPFSGDFIKTVYLITNLEDLGEQAPVPLKEGDFYILYDIQNEMTHHANIVVRVADTLTLACPPLLNGLEININSIDNTTLTGSFSGDFLIFNNDGGNESIGKLSGNFHVPMVPCE